MPSQPSHAMPFEEELVVSERNRVLSIALPLTLAPLGIVQLVYGVELTGSLPFGVVAVVVGLSLRAWLWNWGGSKQRRRIAASPEGVLVDGQVLVRAAQIRSARFVPGRDPPRVMVSGAYGLPLLLAQVADRAEGLRLLGALGHDAGSQKQRFRGQLFATRGRHRAFTVGYLFCLLALYLPAIALLHPSTAVITLMTWLGLAPLLYLTFRGVSVDIGVDGVLVSGPRRKEWIAFEGVRSVEAHQGSARFVLGDRHVDVAITRAGPNGLLAKQDAFALDAFLLRAREALAAHRATVGPRALAAMLSRADRDKAAWVDGLRRLRDGEAAYRSAAIQDEELWRVVEDPGAPEDARAAAAFVLRRQDDPSATARLRVAQQAVAAPRLRVALESDDEDALAPFCEERRSRAT